MSPQVVAEAFRREVAGCHQAGDFQVGRGNGDTVCS